MNKSTKRLLNNYDKNIKSLDISNKEIIGILCLKKFKKLEYLNCCFNKINELVNLPSSLKNLNCYFNEINELVNLPSSLKNLNCSNNKIEKLNNLSENIIELNCSFNKIIEIKTHPSSLKKLIIHFNEIIFTQETIITSNFIYHYFKLTFFAFIVF